MLKHPTSDKENAFVVTVVLEVNPAHRAAFQSELMYNARLTRELEPGCIQFDVCSASEIPDRIFLYELYRQKSDFDAHLESSHFLAFEQKTRSWVISKTVQTYVLIQP